MLATTANAALTITIENSPAYQPGTAMAGVGVFFSSDNGTDSVGDFELKLDILPVGEVYPPGISQWDPANERGISNRNPLWNGGISNTGGFGADFTISAAAGTDLVIPTTPIRMFDFNFIIDPTTVPDSYSIVFGTSVVRTGGGVVHNGVVYNPGALNVVPEPSGVCLALGLLGFAGFRRRRPRS